MLVYAEYFASNLACIGRCNVISTKQLRTGKFYLPSARDLGSDSAMSMSSHCFMLLFLASC